MRGPQIELIRYEPSHKPNKPNTLGSYSLVVRAKGTNVPSEIFIYHAINAENPYSGDVFEAVATPSQMEELPINKPFIDPINNESVPFYRRNQLELYFRSLSDLHEFWEELQVEVNELIENYKIMEELVSTRVATLTGGRITKSDLVETPSSLSTLYTDPATCVDLDPEYNIVTPDPGMFGWLPVSETNSPNAPKNARLFYNIDKHFTIKQVWEVGLKKPHGLHSLDINGYKYSQGEHGIYTINQDGIFWLDFDPEDFSDDRLNLPKPPRNPWPDDYFVGYGSSSPNIIRILLFV